MIDISRSVAVSDFRLVRQSNILAVIHKASEGGDYADEACAARRPQAEAAGVPFDKRVGRLVEGMTLCRALWTGKPVDWDGRWKVTAGTLGPMPHRPGGPPIWISGSVTPARVRAAVAGGRFLARGQ